MARRSGVVVCAVMLAMALAVPGAHAQTASVCTFTTNVSIDPGVSLTPSTGTFTTRDAAGNLETGTVDCQGTLGGAMITGPGTIGYEGTFGDTALGQDDCTHGAGGGTLSYTVPTTAGDINVTGTFQFVRAAVTGGFAGSAGSYGTIAGLFQFMPAAGQDCTTVPVTDATVTGQSVLAG